MRSLAVPLLLGLAVAACDSKPAAPLAPAASALPAAEKRSESAKTFAIEAASSKVTFLMQAPFEKIHGDAEGSAKGELFIDPSDISKTAGLIEIDLDKLVLYQQKRQDEKSDYGERKKSDQQNEHAKTWLEISPDAPAAERELNRWVQFRIDKVIESSAPDVSKLTGAERKITATVEGELRLHQRKVRKQAKVEATFKYDGDKPVSVSIKTTAPVVVDLDAHDVRPRELFGKLAQKTLSDMGQKVAKEAPIEFQISANLK
jgi:DNA replication initiation complex subunit (GINS family)